VSDWRTPPRMVFASSAIALSLNLFAVVRAAWISSPFGRLVFIHISFWAL